MSYNYEELNVDEVRDLLRNWRENTERKSDEVVELWEAVLEDNISKLGNEKHVVMEQVIFAALDCHRYDVADKCIKMLCTEFNGSLRVMRYKAMRLEAMELYEEALEVLDNLIKRDETNAAPRKRRVAILKAQGRIVDAIKELSEYLKRFMSDMEAWQELCELYLSVGDYSKAVFCAEELLLHQPHSHLIHQKVADIRYTMGGPENLELARSYYCQAVNLNPKNMRALMGLFLVSHNMMLTSKSGSGGKKKEATRLAQWTLARVTEAYREAGGSGAYLAGDGKKEASDPLEGMLAELSIAN